MDGSDLFKETTLHLPEENEEERVNAAITSIFG
jgi:hypothetical protein